MASSQFRTRLLGALVATGMATSALVPLAGPAQAATNEAPEIIPALQSWQGGNGHFSLDAGTQIMVSGDAVRTAHTLAGDLSELVGLRPDVVLGTPAPGDIHLVLEEGMTRPDVGDQFAEEGYELAVEESGVTITAPTTTGLYYGTRTLLQALMQSPGRAQLPVGTTLDWPDYAVRGFTLDVGRQFFSPEFIRDYITMMSWYKMNTFQIHLNDNQIFPPEDGWEAAYQAFRLESDDPYFDGLTAEDGSYDRADWQSFEDTAALRGLTIIPEIDAPAHARSFVQWKPEIGLNGGDSDILDLANPEATETMKEVFAEFLPWFEGPVVHFGADEYPGEPELYREYFNEMAQFVRDDGKEPWAWGSLSHMGSAEGYDRDVLISSWNSGYYGMASAQEDGYSVINMNDATLYVVPFADYYHGNGLDNGYLYEEWLPHLQGEESVEPGDPEGAMFAVWNDLVDLDYTELDVHGLVQDSFPVIATKTWNATEPETSYTDFTAVQATIGSGPGLAVIDQGGTEAPGSLSFGAPVTATSTSEGYDAAAVTDGDRLTRWETGAEEADLQIDLGEPATVGQIELDWSGQAPESFDVRVSTDGVFWQYAAAGLPGGTTSVPLANVSARYVELANISAGGDRTGLWGAEVFGPAPLNLGATATASGTEGAGNQPSDAIDGNPATRWSADAGDNPWLQVDFGAPVTFDEAVLDWEAASAQDYALQASPDGETWTELTSVTDGAAGARTDSLTFDQVTTQYLRVAVSARTMSPYLSLYDLTVPDLGEPVAQFVTAIEPGAPDEETGTYLEPPVVTLDAEGTAGAVRGLEYAIGADWSPVTGPITVTGSGDVVLQYRATVGAETIRGAAVLPLAEGAGAAATDAPSTSR